MEEEKKVSDESIVEEAKGETPEETTTEEGTETQETKETKAKKKKKSAAALEIELKKSEEKAAEMVTLYREYFTVTGIFENSVYDGVEEMLKTLKQAGIKIAMATSKPEKFAKIIADHFGLAQYFDVIGGACMDETRTEKQDVIHYVLEQCEEKELDKIVMVGDRSYDILGGHAEGLKVIGVLYGYGDLKELSEAGADALATTPQEVAELVLETE